jgi:hypothetical protein
VQAAAFGLICVSLQPGNVWLVTFSLSLSPFLVVVVCSLLSFLVFMFVLYFCIFSLDISHSCISSFCDGRCLNTESSVVPVTMIDQPSDRF